MIVNPGKTHNSQSLESCNLMLYKLYADLCVMEYSQIGCSRGKVKKTSLLVVIQAGGLASLTHLLHVIQISSIT